jgi:hypothetical protein
MRRRGFADVPRVAVDYQLLEQWRRRREAAQFERRIEQAVAYVERRAEAARMLDPAPAASRPTRLRAVDPAPEPAEPTA